MSRDHDDWILSSLLDDLARLALARDKIRVADVIDTIGARGFGPLLVMLSAFMILPIGMVPGIPGVAAVLMILIGGRMMTGETRLWIPARLGRVEFTGHLLAVSVARAQPVALWLRPFLAPRLPLLIDSLVMSRVVALILMVTGAVIFLAGFIPGLPFVLSLHVLVLGMALSTRDGLAALVGYILLMPEILLIWHLFL
ncbi:exopolysaccharide biosynthesis protein [Rhodovulum adriaticum]|uniref:Exopolysaccharide synthesis protein ExoD n=1 Tax=Rhodovulum adriaticum TaxID=35804 RepID=A0A4R2NW12_RHOAD|nr:exopolysaccharide biosynthesis protein [Rhodovulum adriaticum]MBK1635712.1 hypothetical protein [Rhodovulum adriaticum]TCP26220.1 hypothetical protein EV656_102183 [Rhodovulum adriaticum]